MTKIIPFKENGIPDRLGYYVALATAILTIITFGIALFTPPISGPFCKEACIDYPYDNVISRFPRDYIWMYPAIVLTLVYVVLFACIKQYSPHDKKINGQIALLFSAMAATILVLDYFIQVSVIQPSLLKGEKDGIALLTQYNPHGVFIALEEIGYLLMSLSFICVVPVFTRRIKLENTIRWIFIISFVLMILSFILISIIYGINREYIFEVIAISIDWTALIIAGLLLAKVFKHNIDIYKQ
jgi:hypothetical protein